MSIDFVILSPLTIYKASLEAARDHMGDKNTKRLNDELLNISTGLLRSSSCPGIGSAYAIRLSSGIYRAAIQSSKSLQRHLKLLLRISITIDAM